MIWCQQQPIKLHPHETDYSHSPFPPEMLLPVQKRKKNAVTFILNPQLVRAQQKKQTQFFFKYVVGSQKLSVRLLQ